MNKFLRYYYNEDLKCPKCHHGELSSPEVKWHFCRKCQKDHIYRLCWRDIWQDKWEREALEEELKVLLKDKEHEFIQKNHFSKELWIDDKRVAFCHHCDHYILIEGEKRERMKQEEGISQRGFGKIIKEKILERKLSYKKVDYLTRINGLSAIERGVKPSPIDVIKLAEFFGLDVREMLRLALGVDKTKEEILVSYPKEEREGIERWLKRGTDKLNCPKCHKKSLIYKRFYEGIGYFSGMKEYSDWLLCPECKIRVNCWA